MPSYICVSQQGGWYRRSWLGWAANNSLTDLHPVVPAAYKRIAVQPLLLLPPALRTLHLDARKGRDTTLTFSRPISGTDSPSPASTAGSTRAGEGAGGCRKTCRPEGEPRRNYNNGTVESPGSCCLQRKGTDWTSETNDSVGAGAAGVKLGGCERTLAVHWTERQRTMCLVPDVRVGTVSQ